MEGFTARTYVVTDGNRVVGYYCLVGGSIERAALPKKTQRNTPDSIPIAVIGRLAVDLKYQKTGIGGGLLKDAILRVFGVAEVIGIRAVVVHAIDDNAAAFYKKYGFIDSHLNVRTLVLPLEVAKAALTGP